MPARLTARRWRGLSDELGQDLVGWPGPDERLTALVPAIAEPADRADELLDAGEVAAAKHLTVDDGEEDLDEVEPARRGGREVQRVANGSPAVSTDERITDALRELA
jgi:hypothetical protein